MPQEDKIKREIDRIGLVLARLLAKLLHKDHLGDPAVDVTGQLQSELDVDLDELLLMNEEDSQHLLVNEQKFSIENLRTMGNLLYELAAKTNDEERKRLLLKKALEVYEYISANNKGTLFLDVEMRIKDIRNTFLPEAPFS